MKIVIVTKGERVNTTADLLNKEGIPSFIVTHKPGCSTEGALISGTSNLVDQRNWILENLIDEGEWFIGMDDDIKRFERVPDPFYDKCRLIEDIDDLPPDPYFTWRDLYRRQCPAADFIEKLHILKLKCEEQGTIYGATTRCENPVFRPKRWSFFRFAATGCHILKKTKGINYGSFNYCHDSYLTCRVLAEYGSVVVDNYLFCHNGKMYEDGGLGPLSERREHLDRDLRRIIEEFPGLVMLGRGKNTALKVRLTSRNSIDRWREEHGYIS